MYKLEYEDDICRKFESFFITKELAYSWIKYQRNLREWVILDDQDRIIDYYVNPEAD